MIDNKQLIDDLRRRAETRPGLGPNHGPITRTLLMDAAEALQNAEITLDYDLIHIRKVEAERDALAAKIERVREIAKHHDPDTGGGDRSIPSSVIWEAIAEGATP